MAVRPRRFLGWRFLWMLLLVSGVVLFATPFLAFGYAVVALWDEDIGNRPGYVQAITVFTPHLCVAFLWSVWVLGLRRKWLVLD